MEDVRVDSLEEDRVGQDCLKKGGVDGGLVAPVLSPGVVLEAGGGELRVTGSQSLAPACSNYYLFCPEYRGPVRRIINITFTRPDECQASWNGNKARSKM